MRRRVSYAAAALAVVIAAAIAVPAIGAANNESVDLEMITSIRQEAFRNSKVMDTLSELTDRIGPRLTGSPNMKRANEWTRDQFQKWGLANAHLESYGPFGRGWSEESVFVRMTSPDVAMLIAQPEAWTPSTVGMVRGRVMRAKIEKTEDFEKYRGKLAGQIVVLGDMREVKPHEEAEMRRYDDKRLDEVYQYQAVERHGYQRPPREEMIRRLQFRKELAKFLTEEKPAVIIKPSNGDGGTIFVQGTQAYKKDEPAGVPSLVMGIEHYGRIMRLMDREVPVELEIEVKTKFYDDDAMAYNTVAEIPGADKKDEIVMLGGHMDSWHTGTGATDNGCGVAVAMEAVRILKSLGVKPRRTIRIALWSGEEEGLLGSKAYVTQHIGERQQPKDLSPTEAALPSYMRRQQGPVIPKAEWGKVSAYFNLDNGSGKIRGIYTQENASVRPIFEAWLEPFRDLGATTVTMKSTGGTDHLSFDAVGVPGFQFIQDPLEYDTRTHHSNMDVYERAQKDDLMEAAAIMASFVYNAAMRDQMMPRKPLGNDTQLLRAETKPAGEASSVKVKKAGKKE
ncbi:MAG TPA: M20/M25/M40 family metallo-hydrolase [Terriglobales bacterium]|nr:M20/M25/M40 family metallo-hydrolase [Terriglobales bacterium]